MVDTRTIIGLGALAFAGLLIYLYFKGEEPPPPPPPEEGVSILNLHNLTLVVE